MLCFCFIAGPEENEITPVTNEIVYFIKLNNSIKKIES